MRYLEIQRKRTRIMHFVEDIINYDVTTLYLLSLFAVYT